MYGVTILGGWDLTHKEFKGGEGEWCYIGTYSAQSREDYYSMR